MQNLPTPQAVSASLLVHLPPHPDYSFESMNASTHWTATSHCPWSLAPLITHTHACMHVHTCTQLVPQADSNNPVQKTNKSHSCLRSAVPLRIQLTLRTFKNLKGFKILVLYTVFWEVGMVISVAGCSMNLPHGWQVCLWAFAIRTHAQMPIQIKHTPTGTTSN